MDQDRDVLAKALVVNDTMTSLTLQRSGLLTGGVVLMANALKINRTIAIIDLEGNRFDHDGASAIAATFLAPVMPPQRHRSTRAYSTPPRAISI